MAGHGPPMANDDEEDNDDNSDEMGGHDPPMADVPPPVDQVQPPDNPPREITGVEAADQDEEHGVADCRILGLTTLNSLLQYVNWLVWEVCSVN